MRTNTLHDPRYRGIVQCLIKARIDAGFTQAQLAARLGLSQPHISKIEKCQRRLDILEAIDWIKATQAKALVAFAQALDLSDAQDQS